VLNGYGVPETYFSNEIWTFDRSQNRMRMTTPTGDIPSDRTFHGAVSIGNNRMLIWGGGRIVGFSFEPSNELFIYHRGTGVWNEKAHEGSVQPIGRLGHGMAFLGNKVYMFGGIIPMTNGECCNFLNDMYTYNIDTNKWTQLLPTGTIPSPRGHMGFVLAADNSGIWLQGGEGNGFTVEKGLWRYSIMKNQWRLVNEEVPEDPSQRESQLFNVLGNNRLICFGGDTEGPEFYNLRDDTQIYRITQDEWNLQAPPNPPAAKRMPSVSFGTEVWFFGGNTAFDLNTGVETNHNQVWKWS